MSRRYSLPVRLYCKACLALGRFCQRRKWWGADDWFLERVFAIARRGL